ncbi:hypothetical protein [Solemya velesiana gill symbiont]|uniref:Uncharacterized protein n=1 Tax=Solemya velesiana gill symbiont TaxID=1918948 RepID=A0A1T2KUT5_9GAMM|nr:hypothetical protein BOW51_06875 [Solemya velesiana gill symbiont]
MDQFKPKRSQQRAWNRYASELEVIVRNAAFDPDHYALYSRYISSRHPDGEAATALALPRLLAILQP